jgi:transcriptional regulator
MYRPAAFDMTNESEIADFIDAAGPAHLVTLGTAGLVSSFVPLIFDRESNSLVGHLARANPQWRDVVNGIDALAIFSGPDAYISPSFYPTKQETGKVVPTWNYEVVHASGEFVVHDDAEWVTALVTRLTERHESKRAEPWSVADTPDGFIASMAKAIVGIEIRNVRLEGKRKLSQNRNDADIDGTIAGLRSGTDSERALAAAMLRGR